MNILYLIIIISLAIFLSPIELFKSRFGLSAYFSGINKRLSKINQKVIDVKAQVMGNYKFQCIKSDKVRKKKRTTKPVSDKAEIDLMLDSLSQTMTDEKLPDFKPQPTRKELKRTKYAKIRREKDDDDDGLADIDFRATTVPEHIKLAQHLKCYNTKQYNIYSKKQK